MKKLALKSVLLVALSFLALPVFAVNIQNLNITPDGSKYLEFSWEKLANGNIDKESHYALQWGKYQTDVRIDKDINATVLTTQNVFRMRGDFVFDKNTDYYVRVYGYYRDVDTGRKTFLTKGSKILKFKWLSNGATETSYIEANDPNIISDNATTTVAKQFGKTVATAYDTSVQLSWPTVSEVFDEYSLVLSKSSDLSNPIKEFSVSKSYKKALITGLEAGKKYYIAGYLKRNERNFGKGLTVNFTTLAKFDNDKQRRFNKYILGKKRYGVLLSTGNTAVVETATTETPTTSSSITARITELKRLIAKYQAELNKLEAQNPAKKTLSSRYSGTSSLSSRLRNWRSRR